MPWNPQGGGGGGPSPWGRPGGGNGGGGRGGGGGGGPTPPDIEDMIRKGQERFKKFLPGGMGPGKGLVLIALVVAGVWLATGFYRVDSGHQGATLLFGRYVQSTAPGLHWFFPAPVGTVITPNVEAVRRVDIGFRGPIDPTRTSAKRDVSEESLMLTGDQNIADLDFTVFWKIKDAAEYLFNIRDPEGTVKVAAESAMREVIGQTPLQDALTVGKQRIETQTQDRLQTLLDSYGSGITVTNVQLLTVDPPKAVIDSFNEVQRARQDKERKQNEAQAYRNRILPRARGEAEQIIQEARAHKERIVKEAEGEAKRFVSVFDSYQAAREVTSQRLYLENLQEVLKGANKVIVDDKGQGVVPYLPLPELRKRSGGATAGPQREQAITREREQSQ